MEKIIHFVEEMYVAPLISREKEILSFGDQLFNPEGGAGRPDDSADEPQGLSPEELIASLNRGERSMAEAEGMAEWERRHEGRESTGKPASPSGGALTLDEARVRARNLRNPRDWEKK
jgi:hypothetical protein